ncbi:MAG: hypothetical protein QXX51_03790 [Candidatus Bathyarchaeia archaeon]
MKSRIVHAISQQLGYRLTQQVGQTAKMVGKMPRKRIVKVVLSEEQKGILVELARRLGTSESETLRMALMDYAKELSLMRERIQRFRSEKALR